MKPITQKTSISTDIKTIIALIAGACAGLWAYFGIIERLNNIETNGKLMIVDVEKNTEFRIKWPRGELGSLPADSEQFMLIEHMAGMHNKVNIEFLTKQLEKALNDIEKLKDKVRANGKKGYE